MSFSDACGQTKRPFSGRGWRDGNPTCANRRTATRACILSPGGIPPRPSPIRTLPSAPEFHRIVGRTVTSGERQVASKLGFREPSCSSLITCHSSLLQSLAGFTADRELGSLPLPPSPCPEGLFNFHYNSSTPSSTFSIISTESFHIQSFGQFVIIAAGNRRCVRRESKDCHFGWWELDQRWIARILIGGSLPVDDG